MTERTLVIHCPDWSITAAGFRPEEAVAIVKANIVEVCSANARGTGITIGMRKRQAQQINPNIQMVDADPMRDVAMFEPIVKSAIALAPLVEVFAPGTCMIPTIGPSRYYGGDSGLTRALTQAVSKTTDELGAICQIGIADGPFAARLAAQSCTVVSPGESAQFLESYPLDVLNRPQLISLLSRLGIHTLGQFAAMSESDVTARFGPDGAAAHRLASGLDEHHLNPQPATVDLVMLKELDPPADRVDIAAFTGRSLAVQLLEELSNKSLTCTRVTIEAETESGETLSRCWRFDGVCSEKSLSERIRWQLEGWLSGAINADRPTSGITLLRLIPDQLRPSTGEQSDLWNVTSASDEKAVRGISRVQALLGPDSVQIASVRSGRHPSERALFTAWGEHVEEEKSPQPWPNAIPAPAPAIVYDEKKIIQLFDETGNSVTVNKRGVVSNQPIVMQSGNKNERIIAWTGPWTSDDQWWDAEKRKRRAYLQVVTESGTAHLIAASGGDWLLDATYD